jgi:hypothetical protein
MAQKTNAAKKKTVSKNNNVEGTYLKPSTMRTVKKKFYNAMPPKGSDWMPVSTYIRDAMDNLIEIKPGETKTIEVLATEKDVEELGLD